MQLLLRWVISAGALYATVKLLEAFGEARDTAEYWYSWFIAAIIMGLVNALIRPVARFLTAPLNCLTFGLIGILVNGVMFWLVSVLTRAFSVKPLGAIIGAILIGLISGVASQFLIRDDEK